MQPVAEKSSTSSTASPPAQKVKLGAEASQSERITANSVGRETSSPLSFLRKAVKGCQG